jgi:hypothetical protein
MSHNAYNEIVQLNAGLSGQKSDIDWRSLLTVL